MSVFPFIDSSIVDADNSASILPIAREYAWDYDIDDFLLKDGKFVIVEEAEAVKVWIYKVLRTDRYRYEAYSWNFGVEFDTVLGGGLTRNAIKSEVLRLLTDALLINPYIKSIDLVEATLDGDKLEVAVKVTTIYGEVEVNV